MEKVLRKAIDAGWGLFRTLRDRGPRGAGNYLVRQGRRAWNQVLKAYYERTFGVDVGPIEPWPYPNDDPDCAEYAPIAYHTLRRFLKHAAPVTREGAFLDLGCGLGRALLVGARFPFARVIGVELSPELATRARENVAETKRKLRCGDIQVLTIDAADYSIPPDVTHILIVASFSGPVLASVMENIRQSLEAHPRELKLLWRHNEHWRETLGEYDWLAPVYEFQTYDDGCGVVLENKLTEASLPGTSAGNGRASTAESTVPLNLESGRENLKGVRCIR